MDHKDNCRITHKSVRNKDFAVIMDIKKNYSNGWVMEKARVFFINTRKL